MSKADYMSKTVEQTTINHFYEKLLLLHEMMNTQRGRELAIQRTEYMQGFLDQFDAEWKGSI